MDRTDLEAYILETYSAEPDYPWPRYPRYEVFRHSNNQKWFALIMEVPNEKLGLQGPGTLSIVNLKVSPILIGSFLFKPGFFPAYHMSKDSWISVALDDSAPDDAIRMLLDISFELTAVKAKKAKRTPAKHCRGVVDE